MQDLDTKKEKSLKFLKSWTLFYFKGKPWEVDFGGPYVNDRRSLNFERREICFKRSRDFLRNVVKSTF